MLSTKHNALIIAGAQQMAATVVLILMVTFYLSEALNFTQKLKL